jgi:hypothetical protein
LVLENYEIPGSHETVRRRLIAHKHVSAEFVFERGRPAQRAEKGAEVVDGEAKRVCSADANDLENCSAL